MEVAILGATGCVGQALIKYIIKNTDYKIVAAYHLQKPPKKLIHNRIKWQKIDFSNEMSLNEFLKTPKVLFYLIHSLKSPNFQKIDSELVQKILRSIEKSNLQKIIYLGGIIPKNEILSIHLKSRKKTGDILRQSKVPIIEIRASIIIGKCSDSFKIISSIAQKMPFVIMPKGGKYLCSPILLKDVVEVLAKSIKIKSNEHKIYEIGSATMQYKNLVELCAKHFYQKNIKIITLNYFPIYFAAIWINLISGVSLNLTKSLLESMQNNTNYAKNSFFEITGKKPTVINNQSLQ